MSGGMEALVRVLEAATSAIEVVKHKTTSGTSLVQKVNTLSALIAADLAFRPGNKSLGEDCSQFSLRIAKINPKLQGLLR